MDIEIAEYWDKRAESYALMRREHLYGTNFRLWKKELAENLPASSGLKVLDIGTATGFLAIVAASMGHQVTAIDISAHILEVAREEADTFFGKKKPSITFLQMDAHQLDFPENSFDVVISRNTTWTLNDAAAAYRECYRVLKPGGVLLNYDADFGKSVLYSPQMDQELDELFRQSEKIKNRLSITYVKRPEWDVAVLRDCGFVHCEADSNISRKFSPHGTKGTSEMFVIYAVKPVPVENAFQNDNNQLSLQHSILVKREERFYNRYFQSLGIPDLHFAVLRLLYFNQEGLRPSDISDHQLIPRQTMTHIIRSLTEQGYVWLEKNPKDGRSSILKITAKGSQYFMTAANQIFSLEKQALDAVGPVYFRNFNNFFEKYLDQLEKLAMKNSHPE